MTRTQIDFKLNTLLSVILGVLGDQHLYPRLRHRSLIIEAQ